MSTLEVFYSIVDVFTFERFAGNPVAVIHDASELNAQQMLAVAREFGFSETTFILPPLSTTHHAQVRIFTPREEVPFAGHPNIGTAFVMGTQMTAAKRALPDVAVFDELGGDVRVRLLRNGAKVVGAQIEAPSALQKHGPVPLDLAARCLGLDEQSINQDRLAPCVASVGLPFAFVELRSLEALAAINCDIASFREAVDRGPRTVDGFAICAFVVLEDRKDHIMMRSRVVCPLGHPPEDPATGSASGALAALFTDATNRTEATFAITQGVEMGRPGKIAVEVPASGGHVRIQGYCVEVSTGKMKV